MIKKIKKIILILLATILTSYIALNYFVGRGGEEDKLKTLKDLFSERQKSLIIKYLLPYKLISQQEDLITKIRGPRSPYLDLEINFLKSQKNIQVGKMKDIELTNKTILKKYNLINGFYSGINNPYPGSGYIDFHLDNLIILSARGFLGYSKDINDELALKQIKNNIDEFFVLSDKKNWFSLKDLLIHNDKIYISYTEEIKKDCWNTSLISGDVNYKNIQFKKIFSPESCIHSKKNPDGEFNAHQSGGRIINFDNNHLLLSIGDYRSRYLAQDKESLNGKILKINTNDLSYEIISMGHRNPQGLYFDRENNFILEAEHGPSGGDEINMIEVDKINNDEILNYGWAIVSAGEHYGGKSVERNDKKYKKYPLYKSHSEYGFIEPLKSFVPSIGISEIAKIAENKYVVSSLNYRSLYFFQLNNEKKIINLEKVEVFERVRDLIFKDNKLYLFLEDTASLGIISFN